MGGYEVSRPYRVWFFAEGERFLSFWRCHITNDRCEALASLKGCFLCFCFSPPVFIHRAQILAYKKKKPERREYLFGSGIYKK